MLVIFLAAAVSSRNNKAVSHNKPVVAGVVGGLNAPGRAGVGGGCGGMFGCGGKKTLLDIQNAVALVGFPVK